MSLALKLEENKHYTYADIRDWPEDFHCEIIDGKLYINGGEGTDMPAPNTNHQNISRELFLEIGIFLRSHPLGKVFSAPFDVRLKPKGDFSDDIVIQPDIAVVCDSSKITNKGCDGAPDFVAEILSPSSRSKDSVLKYRHYAESGVREYWIIDPDLKSVQVCVSEDGKPNEDKSFRVTVYDENETAPVHVLPGLEIKLSDIFCT